VLPITPPVLTDIWIFLATLAGLKGLRRPHVVLGIASPTQDDLYWARWPARSSGTIIHSGIPLWVEAPMRRPGGN
jgi:hypothetical protein